jgi:hypothetical protein
MKQQRPAEHSFFNFRNPKWKFTTYRQPRWYKKLAWVMLVVLVATLVWSVLPSNDDDDESPEQTTEQPQ